MKTEGQATKPGNVVHNPDRCYEAMKAGQHCWAHFSSEVDSGRDLFRRLNHGKIKQFSNSVSSKSSGGRYAKAWKMLWDKEDKEGWNKKAREFVDVFQ